MGTALLTARTISDTSRPVKLGMDAALQAHFGRTGGGRLAGAARDFLEVEPVGRSAQIGRCRDPWRMHRSRSGTGRCWCS